VTVSVNAMWGGVIGLLLLLFVSPLVASRVARTDADPTMFRLVMWGAAVKLAAAPAYLLVIKYFYGGVADAVGYFGYGGRLARQLDQGDFHLRAGRFIGDGATRIATGMVEAVIGHTELGTFFVFSFLAFLGLVCFYRAFRVSLPEAHSRRYARLLFFLPSLAFWTAAPSKDSLTLLALGLAALGGSYLLVRQMRGLVFLAMGLGLVGIIRPHLALLAILAVGVAYPLGRSRQASAVTPISSLIGAFVLLVGGLLLAGVVVHSFHLHSLSLHSVHKVLQTNAKNTGTAARSQIGQFNSSEQASTSLSPTAFPRDFYDVLIRPLPIHAHGFTQLGQSAENLFILGLILTSLPRLAAAGRSLIRQPYLLSALLFTVVWIVLFASIGNLGIVARERTEMLPWLLVLVCVPRRPRVAHAPAPLSASTGLIPSLPPGAAS